MWMGVIFALHIAAIWRGMVTKLLGCRSVDLCKRPDSFLSSLMRMAMGLTDLHSEAA